MPSNSGTSKEERISATEASRSFSNLLDQVEKGRRFLVHRRGQGVCTMAPPPVLRRRASECLVLLGGRSEVVLDGQFARDLLDIIAGETLSERLSWDS